MPRNFSSIKRNYALSHENALNFILVFQVHPKVNIIKKIESKPIKIVWEVNVLWQLYLLGKRSVS
jgi:hypothetical protein